MAYEVYYAPDCWEDVKGISVSDLSIIKKAIEQRLVLAPDRLGRPLKGKFKGKWRLRAGDYRIIYKLEGYKIMILKIGNRREVYE